MALVIIVTLVLVFHIAIVYAIVTKQFNPLYLLAGAFAFLSPASTASLLPQVELLKIGRVYCTVLIVVLGFLVYRLFRLGPVTTAFTAFVAFYWIGAVWSDFPITGLLYKGLFGAVFLSGVLLANSTHSLDDLRRGMRILALGGAAFVVFIMLELVRNPAALTHVGRLMAFGINPNFIGQTAAGFLIIAGFLALYDTKRAWRVFGYTCGAMLGIIILYTGSRGSLGMAFIGGVILGFPLVKRPGLFLVSAAFIGIVMYFGLGLVAEHVRERLFHVPEQVRATIWGKTFETFKEAPVFGHGWVYNVGVLGEATGTSNRHTMYLQILAEIGIVGMMFFTLTLAYLGFKGYAAWRYLIRSPEGVGFGYLMPALLLALLAHGVVESSTIVGTTINAILLGFSVALIDRLPVLLWHRECELDAAGEDSYAWHENADPDDTYQPVPWPYPAYSDDEPGWRPATD